MTILLVCAHKWEAEPFVHAIGAKVFQNHPFPFTLYRNKDDFHIVVSGQGAMSAATATAAFLSHCDHSRPILVANFGLAGAKAEDWKVGRSLLVHSVTDQVNQKSIYPDGLVKHEFAEASCLTVSKPATLTTVALPSAATVYEMEAYGVCRAAELYVPSSHLVVGKFISDHLQPEASPDWQALVDIFLDPYTDACQSFLGHLRDHQLALSESPRRKSVKNAQLWWEGSLIELTDILPLTVTQQRQLKSRLQAFALGSQGSESLHSKREELLQFVIERKGETKSEHSKVLEGLLGLLATPPLFSPLR